MQSKAKTVNEYLDELPADRRVAIEAIRAVLLKNLDPAYEEGVQYGMIGYYVPHSLYPAGYHCDPRQPLPFAGLASQKNHMALYLMCLYGGSEQEAKFRREWVATGKKLDMGKCCVRFKKLQDVPLDVVGRAVARVPVRDFIAYYETALGVRAQSKPRSKPAAAARRAPSTTARKKTRAGVSGG